MQRKDGFVNYLVFARKYRPQDFSEVIGQEAIVRTLSESIQSGRIYHAYLFAGPRGVGKTTVARIVAKALNCQTFQKPSVKPCGTCPSCASIQQGNALDVIEIDGASNRGIDEIRTLRENIHLAPSLSRYKIYIIDEVHMLTEPAFNALLKTLEEPPLHVKFIFATTEPNKLPLTILSRCQKFNFQLVEQEKIVRQLMAIAQKENIRVDETIAATIAANSGGSIRDAESLFDQLVPSLLSGASLPEVFEMLGIIDEKLLFEMSRRIIQKDTKACLEMVEELIHQGRDFDSFLKSLLEFFRQLLCAKIAVKVFNSHVGISPETKKHMNSLSQSVQAGFLLNCMECFLEIYKNARNIDSFRIPLEVALIRLTCAELSGSVPKENPKTPELKTAKFLPGQEHAQEKTSYGKEITADDFHGIADELFRTKKNVIVQEPKEGFPEIPDREAKEHLALKVDEIKSIWEQVLLEVEKAKISIGTFLREGDVLGVEKNHIIVGFPLGCSLHRESLEKRENKKLVEDILARCTGKDIGIRYMLSKDVLEKKKPDNTNEVSKKTLNNVIDTFGGEVVY